MSILASIYSRGGGGGGGGMNSDAVSTGDFVINIFLRLTFNIGKSATLRIEGRGWKDARWFSSCVSGYETDRARAWNGLKTAREEAETEAEGGEGGASTISGRITLTNWCCFTGIFIWVIASGLN